MNNSFEKATRVIIIALLLFLSYCLFEISKNGRYQLESISTSHPGWIIDTQTGRIYKPSSGYNPSPYSHEIK